MATSSSTGATAHTETASWGRRIVALAVDWIASTLLVIALVGWPAYSSPGGPEQWLVLAVYVVESAVLGWLVGGSFGKLMTRLRILPADDARGTKRPIVALGILLVRQALVALVIPPLVFRPDGRGLHDLAAGTQTVTLETQKAALARRTG